MTDCSYLTMIKENQQKLYTAIICRNAMRRFPWESYGNHISMDKTEDNMDKKKRKKENHDNCTLMVTILTF